MKKSFITLVVMLALSGCAGTSVYVGTGHDLNKDHEGTNPVAVLRVDQQITDGVSCGWLHVSNVFDGKPFNNRDERVSDIAHCGYEYKFK